MDKNLERVKLLARDLRDGKQFPRSPRQTLAGYVLAVRAVDKCRAVLLGWEGEYHSNCPLDQRWLKFAEIDYDEFRSFVASGCQYIAGQRCTRAPRELFPIAEIARQQLHFFEVLIHRFSPSWSLDSPCHSQDIFSSYLKTSESPEL
jgi:hypothetical protein